MSFALTATAAAATAASGSAEEQRKQATWGRGQQTAAAAATAIAAGFAEHSVPAARGRHAPEPRKLKGELSSDKILGFGL